MQCSNCQFQNIPGVQLCGRCGASLQLASLPIDVRPPRAGRAAKRLRRWFPITWYWNRFRTAAALPERLIAGWPADLQMPAVLLRLLVPGWAHHYLGRFRRAWWMFGGYLAFLSLGLLFIGTGLGWLLLGFALSIHAASILDIVAADIIEFRRRLIYTAIAMLLLVTAVYYPAGHLLARVATPQRFNLAAFPFQAGDVVLVNPSAYRRSDPQPGDVVNYRLLARDVRVPGPGPAGHGAFYYRLQGDRVDRILAKPGQKVTCSQGKLLVDGQASPWLPLGAQTMPKILDLTVPQDCYLIFPSTEPLPPEAWLIASIVPRRQISGRVYWRNQPLWRFGPIR